MKRWLCCFEMVLIMAGFASAEDWTSFRKGTDNTAFSSEHLTAPLSLEWTFEAEDKIVSSPTIKDGKVFIGSRDSHLYAVDAASGTLSWKYKAGNWIDSTPALEEERVYFASRDGFLYCLDLFDGSLVWKHETASTDMSSPKINDGKVFSGTGFPNKLIYALDASTGSKKWEKEADQMVYSSPALTGDQLFIGSNDGKLYGLDKNSGQEVWSFKTRGGIYMMSPAVKDNRVFFASGDFDWSVYALDRTSGDLLWEHSVEDIQFTPSYVSSPAVGQEEVFVVSGYAQQHLYCLRITDGSQKWKAALGPSTRYGFASSPCLSDDTAYVVSAKGMLKAFEISTGRLVWEYDLGSDVLSSPSIANGVLYVATLDGKLHAFK